MKPLDRHIREDLNRRLTLIGTELGADVVTIVSPGRAIDMRTLQGEVGLKIDDIRETEFHKCVRDYFELLKDYMQREQLFSFVHTREYF